MEQIREEISEEMHTIITPEHMETVNIDNKIYQWYKIIETSIRNNMATTSTKIIQKTITSPHLIKEPATPVQGCLTPLRAWMDRPAL